jgi:calcium channel MID1
MRLLSTTLQCYLTATVITTFALLVFASTPIAHAEGVSPHGLGAENLNVGGPVVSDEAGLPFALDSFNGLELRDSVDENGESNGLDLVRRYPKTGTSLANNNFQEKPIEAGETQWWYITKEVVNGRKAAAVKGLPAFLNSRGLDDSTEIEHELRRRDLEKRSSTVYLSLTTCQKPTSNDTVEPGSFPQLEVYVSLSEKLQEPGPGKNDTLQNKTTAAGGYVGIEFDADGDVFIGVSAPNSTAWSGSYKYQIAASIDALFHAVDDDHPFLHFVDADNSAALLVTDNLTLSDPNSTNYQQWMSITPPYTMFAHNTNGTALAGLERSFCALDELAQMGRISNSVDVSMTSRGLGNKPKEQFYITGLNRSSTYDGILAMVGNSTLSGNGVVGGGGKVWMPMNFTTKAGWYRPCHCHYIQQLTESDDNCAVLFNLSFCSEVAYAVPSNPNLSVSALRDIYDNNAQSYYQNFTYSLQQIQCDAEQDSMFSLTVGCDDCAQAYKQWLCSVRVPRCADFSSNESFLMVRNAGQDFINGSSLPKDSPYRQSAVTNSSRNTLIDTEIQPGPYKEILPCQDICHSLVRSCPMSLGFGCPTGQWLNASYGYRNSNGDITCSYLGAAYYLNVGAKLGIWGSVYMLFGMWGVWWALW